VKSKNKKILCITPSYYPAIQFGGPIQALRSLMENLNSLDCDVKIITTNKGCKEIKSKSTRFVDNIEITYHNSSKLFDIFNETGWHFSLSLLRQIIKEGPKQDIFYCRAIWNFPTLAAYIVARVLNKPLIVAATGKLYPIILNKMSFKKRIYWNLFVKRILKYSFIHFTSEKEKKSCLSSYIIEDKSIIIKTSTNISSKANDVIKNFSSKKIKSNGKRLLFLGRLHPIKGLEILIKTYNKIFCTLPNTTLILSGPDEGEYKKKLIKLINDLEMDYADIPLSEISKNNIDGKIVFTGMINEDEKIWLLSQIDVYCHLSISEGFSNSIIEAMSMKKPVVISDGCNFDEVSEKNLGFIGKQISEHTSNILTLFKDEDLSKSLGQNGFDYIEANFSGPNIARDASNIISEIIRE